MSSAGYLDGKDTVTSVDHVENAQSVPGITNYRLYKRRFSGLLGFIILGIVTGMQWSWFGPIATDTANEFDISLAQVNWLGNMALCVSLPASFLVPVIASRYGIRRCSEIGGVMLLISAWVRYAGTIRSLSPHSAYVLLFFGQLFGAISKPVFPILGPVFSERWFDLKSRTTATMAIAIAGPIGSALGQLLSPSMSTVRQSIVVLSIISTAALPAVLLILDWPPSPPTYSGSKQPLSFTSLFRATLGLAVSKEAYMSRRERIDFVILTLVFGSLDGAINVLSVLSAQWFQPVGYSDTTCGLLGATLFLSGITAAVFSAPLFDRVFTHSMGVTFKTLVPIVSLLWLSLIWAAKPNNAAALFVSMAVIGSCCMTILPLAIELGIELTRNANGSSAILWCSGNLFGIILILVEGALRAPSTADPPYNMRDCTHPPWARREVDEAMIKATVLGAVNTGGVRLVLQDERANIWRYLCRPLDAHFIPWQKLLFDFASIARLPPPSPPPEKLR
ncbi:major facilitator superfamily domain-containing protein [Pisolithus orientalis]|uniref:major facilitator superfamily domain-containing protein n=1 Tax=Pisolithus orientalis TaxID=936130 RepID=UPI00222553BC|nr:major facilitator superfamily domain-containing protein [Pisolithus orientalis]KAI6002257.1 major facilitator superfamily domain-containing protein [Pisolithus orientalis]